MDLRGTARDSEMSRIWRYVLATDSGMAPCIQKGMLSLSCCKPMIRRYACLGEWVIGFVPKGKNPGRVAWVGKVKDIVPLGEYERRFRGMKDAIYRQRSRDGEILKPLRNNYHADELSRSRDRRGKNALIFDPFWYWGGDGIPAPDEIADLAHYYVGQSAKNSSPAKIELLEAWARSIALPGVHGKPRNTQRPSNKKRRRRLGVCA
jgi:hypothetical protein